MIILKDLLKAMYLTEEIFLSYISVNGAGSFQGTSRELLDKLPNDILYSCVDRIGVDEGDLFIDTSKENE